MVKPVIVFGAATLSELALEILAAQNREVLGVTADKFPEEAYDGLNFLGLYGELKIDFKNCDFCVCVGDNLGRMEVTNRITTMGGQITNAIHPQSFISQSARIGVGNIIFPSTYIGTQVSIGNGNVIFPFASLTHHSNIGNFTFFAPNSSVGGHSKIENFAKLGMNSTVVAHSFVDSNTHIAPGEVFGEIK
jgi:acetyltransferase-like isoleucine patch superfamily enzyme